MADNTAIEWADATVNAVNGCTRVSPGCGGPGPHGGCYAERLAGTRMRNHPSRAGLTTQTSAGPRWTGDVRLHEPALLQPLRWKRPRRIFWNAHGDLFHDAVPDEWIDRVFAVCALTPQHTHMILTKRSARMQDYFAGLFRRDRIDRQAGLISLVSRNEISPPASLHLPLPNVWLGVSVEDQQRADERIPDLLATPAAIRFISAEPLLGPLNLRQWLHDYGCSACGYGGSVAERCRACGWQGAASYQAGPCPECGEQLQDDYACPECGEPDSAGDFGPTVSGHRLGLIDWIIVGGESGPNARPLHPDWARSLRDQCAAANVPFHFKQWGEYLPEGQFDVTKFQWAPGQDGRVHWWIDEPPYGSELPDAACSIRIGKRQAGRLLDGVEHNGVPA